MTKMGYVKSLGLVIGLSLASVAFGQTLELVSGSADNGGADACNKAGCFYTSPYGMSLNNTPVELICDDFSDEITDGESWNVSATLLSNINGGANGANDNPNVYFQYPVNGTYTQQELYVAAAYLAVQIDYKDQEGSLQQVDDSLALWELFDPTDVTPSLITGTNVCSNCTLNFAASYQAALNYALYGSPTATSGTPITGSTFENGAYTVTIYTPETNGSPDKGAGRPQEFIGVTVPEPSTLAFLGFDFAGAGIIGLCFLRRKSRARS